MNLEKVILYILIFVINSAFAFNFEECRRNYNSPKPNSYFGMSSSSTYTFDVTTIPTDAITSGTEFLSSIGRCRAIDFRDKEKLEYIEYNFDQLKIQSAAGQGEALEGLAVILKCPNEKENFSKFMQDNFLRIFSPENDYDYEKFSTPSETYNYLQEQLSLDLNLKSKCKF